MGRDRSCRLQGCAMSGHSLIISAELAASIQRMKSRTWLDADVQAFERGSVPTKPASLPVKRVKASRFVPRQRQRSPDRRASRDRRRRLGGSSALPDTLRSYYTEGQRSVLCIIAGEIKRHGVCDLPIDQMAALAGVCRTTVQTTLHEGRRLGHLKITERPIRGRKSLTNLVQIVSKDWLTWVTRAPSAHRPIGSKTVNLVSTTKSIDLGKEKALQGCRFAEPPPSRFRLTSSASTRLELGVDQNLNRRSTDRRPSAAFFCREIRENLFTSVSKGSTCCNSCKRRCPLTDAQPIGSE